MVCWIGVPVSAVELIDQSDDLVSPLTDMDKTDGFYQWYLFDASGNCVSWAGIDSDILTWKVTATGEYKLRVILAPNEDILPSGDTYDFHCVTLMDGQNGLSTNWFFRGVTEDYTPDTVWSATSNSSNMIRTHEFLGGKKIQDTYSITNYTLSKPCEFFWLEIMLNLYKGDNFTCEIVDASFTKQSDSGKISSILEYIKNLPTNIKNALKSLFDGITNAISNAVSSILDGIKNLFVPTQADITAYKDKWDQLLQQRFGALYQCVSLVQSYWQSLNPTQPKSSIEFPMVAIDVGNGVYWEFGGYDVTLIPTGFEYLLQVLRMIVNAICTMAVLNVLKNKYERLMDG